MRCRELPANARVLRVVGGAMSILCASRSRSLTPRALIPRALIPRASLLRVSLAAALVGLAACGGAPREGWAARDAIALDAPWPEALPAKVAAQLDAALATRRYVLLGEGDHYVHEKYAYRLAFLRHLVGRGARRLAFELGGSDAQRIDRYLETGDERWLDRVVLWGYAGDSDLERRELAPFAHRSACGARFAADERAFFRAVRALSEQTRAAHGERLRVFGFDYDATPGGGFQDARDALAGCAVAHEVEAMRARLTPPAGSSGDAEVARLEAIAAELDDAPALTAACGAPSVAQARAAIALLAFSYRTSMAWAATQGDASPAGLARYRAMFVAREQHMDVALSAWLAEQPDAPAVLFGHDLHLARDAEQLTFGRAPQALPMWRSVGTALEARHPGQTYVVWLLYQHGTRLAPQPDGTCVASVDVADDQLERALGDSARVTPDFLPLAGAPAGSAIDRALSFGTPTSEGGGPIRSSVDAVIVLPTARASGP